MWNKINKPIGPTYTSINPQGKETYDQFDVSYDDVNTFYDGVNPAQWTDVNKPVGPSWNNVPKPI